MRQKAVFLFLLLLGIVTLVNAQTDLFENGFESGLPVGWLFSGVALVSSTTSTIPDVQPTIPYEGNYCAGMSSYEGNYMISPLKNNPGQYYFFVHKKDTGNHQFLVEFQVEDWVTPGADLTGNWILVDGDWSSQGWWAPLIVDLTGYAPGYVRIRPTPPPPTPLKYMYFDRVSDVPLPIELASFTAGLVQQLDQQYLVKLNWTTQSETQVAGYNVYKNSTTDANTAQQINLGLIGAANTSSTTSYEYIDPETETGITYYWLESNDMNGSSQLHGPISIMINPNNQEQTPGIASLLSNAYPNPFHPSASAQTITIPFQLTSKSNVKLEVYNQKGQLVWVYDRTNADAGMYKVDWNGKDIHGKTLSSGVYFCRMISDNYLGIQKLMLIR